MRRRLLGVSLFVLAGCISVQAATHGAPRVNFGVNLSGPEFAPWNGQTFPTSGDLAYLAARGVTFVRLPIAWESIEPTLGGALDATYLGEVQTAISTAWSYGIGTLVEIHNFSFYCQQSSWVSSGCGYAGNAGSSGSGVNYMGDGTLTQANFNTLWGNIAQALAGTPGLIGYGLMNEPQPNLPGTNTLYAPTNLLIAPNGLKDNLGPQNWSVANAAVVTQLQGQANPLGAGYGPPWQVSSGSGFGAVNQPTVLGSGAYSLSCDMRLDPFFPTSPGILYIGATNSGNLTLSSSWARYKLENVTPGAGSKNIIAGPNAAAGNAIDIANCDLRSGTTAATDLTYQPNPLLPWLQGAVTAIRNYDAQTPVYIDGIGGSGAYTWQLLNWETATLSGGPFVYDAHYYPDGTVANGGGGGVFSGNYTSYGVNQSEGQIGFYPFIDWCLATNSKCLNGEFGIPNDTTDADSQWLPLSQLFYQQLESYRVVGTMWFYGSNGLQPSNNLNVAPTSIATNGTTAAGNATLHFASVSAKVQAFNAGSAIRDLTTPSAIPGGTTIASTTSTTIVMSANAAGAGVGSGDVIQIDDLRLTQMMAIP